jgi:predicted outer membrane repeat protein
MRISGGFLFCLFLFASTPGADAATWHVPGDFDTVTEALEAALDGDTIEIAPGTYGGEFRLEKDLTLVGDPQDPGSVVLQVASLIVGAPNAASLSGLTFSGIQDPDNCAITGQATFAGCVFRDFQIQDSWGIIVMFADIQFTDCLFTENHNMYSVFWILSNGRADFLDCRFLDNTGLMGAAITQFGDGSTTLRRCELRGNHTTAGGGALAGCSGWTIESCLFAGNTSDGAGGAILGDGYQVCQISDCTFTGNAAAQGGALATDEPYFAFALSNTDFTGNQAPEGPDGYVFLGCDVGLTCCATDLELWAGAGQVSLDNEGCSVGTRALSWDGVKAIFR